MTIFISTHYMDEADELCDRIGIIDYGKIQVIDTPKSMKSAIGNEIISFNLVDGKANQDKLIDQISKIEFVKEVKDMESPLKIWSLGKLLKKYKHKHVPNKPLNEELLSKFWLDLLQKGKTISLEAKRYSKNISNQQMRLDNYYENQIKLLEEETRLLEKEKKVANKNKINITYSNEQFIFNEFTMTHNPGDIEINGLFSLTNDQNLSLHIKNLSGKDVSRDVFKVPPETGFNSNIDLTAFWQGTAVSPLLNMNLNVDDISIKKRKIGTLITSLNYDNSGLNVDLNFLDTLYNIKNPKLKIEGVLPIDLSLQQSELSEYGKKLHLSLEANDFELVTLSGLIPFIKELNGELIGEINIDGTMEDLNLSGNAAIHDVSFTAELNNIKYEAFASVLLENDDIIIDSLYLKNTEGTNGGGTIVGGGKITHKNLEVGKMIFAANGKLKILAKETRAANPTIYGDLSITTLGDMVYIYDDNENFFSAELLINKGAEVTITPARSGFSTSSDRFIYQYKTYLTTYDDNALIDSLIVLSDLISKRRETKPSRPNNLNLRIKIDVEDEAKIVFVLSPEFKQNLTAYLAGNFEYTIVDNNPVARGELNLLEGSKLEFIKPFEALGSVKFFDELDNPYLDVTASYQDYYLTSDTVGVTSGEKEVEIRIRLEGPLNEMDKNFIQQEGNISVYIRDKITREKRWEQLD
ncbi:MAG: hypothetical protein IH784_07530, partial [Bacteroidetes bacterium]|nr:hypothetical protein [Bacteroidota bacterium]